MNTLNSMFDPQAFLESTEVTLPGVAPVSITGPDPCVVSA